MSGFFERVGGWDLQLETKKDFEKCMERIYAWFEGELLDRPPIRFARHNAEFEMKEYDKAWNSLRERWFDAQYVVDSFAQGVRGKHFHAETFPMFWPNLGPNVFAACYGVGYEFGEMTAWADESFSLDEYDFPGIDWKSEYLKKLDEMTDYALESCSGLFMVGYTDIHPGLDWAAAMFGTQELLLAAYDAPQKMRTLGTRALGDFFRLYDHFDDKLKKAGQLSVTWMNIPSFQKLHIPSCDFSSMISREHFREFAYEGLKQEMEHMDQNIFHIDGKHVALHTDDILTLPKLNAIQWVQGVAEDEPIMQWVPYIKKIQAAGKGLVVDVTTDELDDFMDAVNPRGIYLCVSTKNEEEELEVIKRAEKWAARSRS